MRVVTWNINSLRARQERVEEWVAEVAPDVLCLQETKLADDAFPALTFEAMGYECAHYGQGQWNGVAILSKVGIDDVVTNFAGETEPDPDARIITATNRNLEQLVEQKKFRQDLYYRINVLPIHIPPLGERSDDIPLLVEHFLFQLATKLGKPIQVILPDGMDKLLLHDWPGKLRELKNVVERAAILCDGKQIDINGIVFSHEIGQAVSPDTCQPVREKPGVRSLKEKLAEYEIRMINETLAVSKSIREAAKQLKISHTALLNKLKKYDIKMEIKRTIVNKKRH